MHSRSDLKIFRDIPRKSSFVRGYIFSKLLHYSLLREHDLTLIQISLVILIFHLVSKNSRT